MSVYVDSPGSKLGRMGMCHMLADSKKELVDMAVMIGVNPWHIQCEGTTKEHFGICLTKRKLALQLGAKSITTREMVELLRRRRRRVAALFPDAPRLV